MHAGSARLVLSGGQLKEDLARQLKIMPQFAIAPAIAGMAKAELGGSMQGRRIVRRDHANHLPLG